MFSYIIRRILLVIPVYLGLTASTFTLIRLVPGDIVQVMMGERAADPALRAAMLHRLGLDKPIIVQYWDYLSRILRGDFGETFRTRVPVLQDFLHHFVPTLELALCAVVISAFFGVILGIAAALKRGTWPDYLLMSGALAGYSMPIYLLGPILTGIFSHYFGLLPVSGVINVMNFIDIQPLYGSWLLGALSSGDFAAVVDVAKHFVLPAVALSTIPLAMIARMTRSAVLEVLGEDYVRTAKAKGLSPARIIFVHVLRNAMITVVTVVGLQAASLMAGAILTETIFSWPGVGTWLLDGFFSRDYPIVQNGILLVATVLMLVSLMVDITYGLINPRIRHV